MTATDAVVQPARRAPESDTPYSTLRIARSSGAIHGKAASSHPLTAPAGLSRSTDANLHVYGAGDATAEGGSDRHSRPSRSAAQLALRTYQRAGIGGLRGLVGAFALAVIETRGDGPCRIVLHRESLGRRSLYYRVESGFVAIAQEPSELITRWGVSAEADTTWLTHFFALDEPPDNRTPFHAIREVLPGETVTIDGAGVRRDRPPSAIGRSDRTARPARTLPDRFRTRLDQAVQRTLPEGDEPVGVMLSSGMDSVPMCALAQHARAIRGQGPVSAYSWSFPNHPQADETELIQATARSLGCPVTFLEGETELPMTDLANWPVNPNSPIANPFRRMKLAAYRAAAAEGCAVILNGSTGDTLYAHPAERLIEAWRDRRIGLLAQESTGILTRQGVTGLWRDPALRRLGKAVLGRPRRSPAAPAWLTAEAQRRRAETLVPWPPEAADHPRPEHLRAALGRRAAAAVSDEAFFARRCGVERREPYHDADLIDLMLSIPSYYGHRSRQNKWIAREAMRGWIPEAVRQQPRHGLLGSLVERGYQRARPELSRLLNAVDRAWPDYVDPAWLDRALEGPRTASKARLVVWQCASFELWRQAWSGDHPGLLRFAHGDR